MKKSDWIQIAIVIVSLGIILISFPNLSIYSFCGLAFYVVYKLYNLNRHYSSDIQNQKITYQHKLDGSKKDMHRLETQINMIFSNIPNPLTLMDQNGKLVLYNEHFERFLTHSQKEMIDYRDEYIEKELRLFLKECYLTEKAITLTKQIQGIDYQCICVPIFEQNRYEGCLAIFQDISAATEKERLQKRFIEDASHELKTPIAAIKGMVEILNRPDFNDEEARNDFLLQIEKESKRLEFIVQDLLQLSRLQSNQLLLQKEEIDLNEIATEAINEIKNTYKPNLEISLTSNLTDKILLDHHRAHQMIINLLKNCCIHSEATQVEIELIDHLNDVKIIIKDNGIGIAEDELQHLFERFYRVDTHRSRQSGGNGLGLSIVKSIVLAFNGDIKVVSEKGIGTQFIITVPKN